MDMIGPSVAVLRQNRDMAAAGRGHGAGTVGAMTKTFVLGLVLLTAACSTATERPPGPGLSKVLLMGDSIAAGEALPLAEALDASGVTFESIASDGGGNVVGPFSPENWRTLPERIESARPDVVVYQLTTYDWGSREEQRAGYARLLSTVTGVGARLVFVTAPPIRPDDFYRPHMADLDRAPAVAREVASSGKATVLDASAVWGGTYQRVRDGKADRGADGVHTCPQGAARFTDWLLHELATLYPGFTPATARRWANTGWSADIHFRGC
jgi:hypothetical protein